MKAIPIVLVILAVAAVIVFTFVSINMVGLITLSTLSLDNSLNGLLVTDIDIDQNTVYLASGCYVLPIAISDEQTFSIAMGTNNIINVRPVSHDLIKTITENYEINVVGVKIHKFENGTYYARLITIQGNRILDMDARPSDAVAIAVRTKSPIYVKQSIMETHGQNFC